MRIAIEPERDAQPRHEAEQVGAEELVGLLSARRIAAIAKTTPTINDRCAMVLTTGGAVRSRCFMGAALISDLPCCRRHLLLCIASCRLRSLCRDAFGRTTGRVAPDPGSRNLGGSEGIFCPAGTSAMVAFWLSCRART